MAAGDCEMGSLAALALFGGRGHAQGAHRRAEQAGGTVHHQPGERGVAGQTLRRAKAAVRYAGHRRAVLIQEQPGEAVSGAQEGAGAVHPRDRPDRHARAQRAGRPLAADLSAGQGRSPGQDDAQLSGHVLRHAQQLAAL